MNECEVEIERFDYSINLFVLVNECEVDRNKIFYLICEYLNAFVMFEM